MTGGIWYYEPAVHKKSADRPHNLTLLLGMLSPLLAVVATSISLMSLRTSEQALEVGQRAYLSPEVADVVSSTPPAYVVSRAPKGTKVIHFRIRLTIKNVGNTPMAASARGTQYMETFPAYRDKPVNTIASGVDVLAISPRSELILETPPHDILIKPSDGPFDQAVRTTGEFIWQDVFGKKHQQTWCYIAQVGDIEKVVDTEKRLPNDVCRGFLSLSDNPPRGFPRDPVVGAKNQGWRSVLKSLVDPTH
jgi:hypothetical protein